MRLFSALLAAPLVVTLAFTPDLVAQRIEITTRGPVPSCTQPGLPTRSPCNDAQNVWLSVQSLQKNLERQGARVHWSSRAVPTPNGTVRETHVAVTWTEGANRQGRFEFPASNEGNRALAAMIRGQHPQRAFRTPELLTQQVFSRSGVTFVEGDVFLEWVRHTANVPVRVERPLHAPVLHIGRLRLQLDGEAVEARMHRALATAVTRFLSSKHGATVLIGANLLPGPGDTFGGARGYARRVRVAGAPGEVYAVVRPVSSARRTGLGFDLVTVNERRELVFRTAHPSVRFTGNVRALASSGGDKPVVALLRVGSAGVLNDALNAAVEIPR